MQDTRLHDLFGRSALPTEHLDRQARVAMLLEAADALVGGESVTEPASRLLGRALRAWLEGGGDLDQLLEIRAPAGSHSTPPAIVRRLSLQGVVSEAERATETRRFEQSP